VTGSSLALGKELDIFFNWIAPVIVGFGLLAITIVSIGLMYFGVVMFLRRLQYWLSP
jgi:hypothetical protein